MFRKRISAQSQLQVVMTRLRPKLKRARTSMKEGTQVKGEAEVLGVRYIYFLNQPCPKSPMKLGNSIVMHTSYGYE